MATILVTSDQSGRIIILGDFNQDGVVDLRDLMLLSNDWLQNSPVVVGADGLGKSLTQIGTTQCNNAPNNWQASAPTPGAANP